MVSKVLFGFGALLAVSFSAVVTASGETQSDSDFVKEFLNQRSCRLEVTRPGLFDSSKCDLDHYIDLVPDLVDTEGTMGVEISDIPVSIGIRAIKDQAAFGRTENMVGVRLTAKLNPQARFWPSVYKKIDSLLHDEITTSTRYLEFKDLTKAQYRIRVICGNYSREPSSLTHKTTERTDLLSDLNTRLEQRSRTEPAKPTAIELEFIAKFKCEFDSQCEQRVESGQINLEDTDVKAILGETAKCTSQIFSDEYLLMFAQTAADKDARCLTEQSANISVERISVGLLDPKNSFVTVLGTMQELARVNAGMVYDKVGKELQKNCPSLSNAESQACVKMWDQELAGLTSSQRACIDSVIDGDEVRADAFESLFFLNCHSAIQLAKFQNRNPLETDNLEAVRGVLRADLDSLCERRSEASFLEEL